AETSSLVDGKLLGSWTLYSDAAIVELAGHILLTPRIENNGPYDSFLRNFHTNFHSNDNILRT
ncbi:hypothetical protein LEMLEM_LOCUS19822, partial [Lemmus lemmus]